MVRLVASKRLISGCSAAFAEDGKGFGKTRPAHITSSHPLRLALFATIMVMLSLPANAGEMLDTARTIFKPIPAPAKLDKNTQRLVTLGRSLYFDPRFSGDGLTSCNTCHNLAFAGTEGREPVAKGHGRNAPTVLNAVFNVAQYWDGRAATPFDQVQMAWLAVDEMNSNPARLQSVLSSIPGYQPMFKAAFPHQAKPVSIENASRAVAAFLSTLVTPGSRFDAYLAGQETALNAAEKRGLAAFMDKGCAGCHGGIALGGTNYLPFGVSEKPSDQLRPPQDKGRSVVTKDKDDEYFFRTAPLRNVHLTAPYFHSGRVWNLQQAVSIMADTQLGSVVKLTDGDRQDITAFLKTLAGKPPKVEIPTLPEMIHKPEKF